MTSTTFFILFVPILAVLLLAINLVLAPHNPYEEKDSVFECGYHSFLGQNRTQFSISFFIFALLFLLFDLEILLVYPYSVSSYTNDIYGLIVMMVFFIALTLGFIFELGKNALSIESKQNTNLIASSITQIPSFIGSPVNGDGIVKSLCVSPNLGLQSNFLYSFQGEIIEIKDNIVIVVVVCFLIVIWDLVSKRIKNPIYSNYQNYNRFRRLKHELYLYRLKYVMFVGTLWTIFKWLTSVLFIIIVIPELSALELEDFEIHDSNYIYLKLREIFDYIGDTIMYWTPVEVQCASIASRMILENTPAILPPGFDDMPGTIRALEYTKSINDYLVAKAELAASRNSSIQTSEQWDRLLKRFIDAEETRRIHLRTEAMDLFKRLHYHNPVNIRMQDKIVEFIQRFGHIIGRDGITITESLHIRTKEIFTPHINILQINMENFCDLKIKYLNRIQNRDDICFSDAVNYYKDKMSNDNIRENMRIKRDEVIELKKTIIELRKFDKEIYNRMRDIAIKINTIPR